MKSFMENTKIGGRIAAALVLPIIGLLIFSGTVVVDKYSTSGEMEKLHMLSVMGPTVSALVHELQKERGTSAVYIGSKGKKFSKELPAQKKTTDEKRAALENALKSFNTPSFGSGVETKVKAAVEALGPMQQTRENVSGFKITVPKMASYYTPLIAKLLAIVEEMAVISTDAEVTNGITAYTQFLQGKERAGIERAMGGAGFGAGKFAPPIYKKFIELIAQQQIFLSTFNIYASQAERDFYTKTVTGKAVDEVIRMRKIAVDSAYSGNTQGIEGPYWFGTITQKIEMLKKVEDLVAANLERLANDKHGSAQNIFLLALGMTLVLLVITAVFVTIVIRGITRPIDGITSSMTVLANGDKSIEIEGAERGDEIGRMAEAVQVFKENMIKNDEMAEAQRREDEIKQQRAEALEKMAAQFESNVGSSLEQVTAASDSMKMTAEGMASTAEQTSQQSVTVAAAAEEASSNVQTVAAAAEELTSSISEISRQVSQSNQVSKNAVEEAGRANDMVQGLVEAAQKIGEVVKLITDIAEQTNLLALNATIEAARAGDAGKGFAVVAGEVKNLANQTARATDEISAQITSIQGATQDAVQAIGSISSTIGQLNEVASAIAAAVEEQGAATNEIARNIEQAATGTQDVTVNISGVNQAADQTGQAAGDVLEAVGTLTMQSDDLNRQVQDFLRGIKEI